MTKPLWFFLTLPVLSAALTCYAQDRTADPLRGVTQCVDRTEFHAKSMDRLPAGSTMRTVDTGVGPKQVSTADGYRLMLYRQTVQPLVNLKIERSAPGKFGADRDAIMLQLAALADGTKAPHRIVVETSTRDGIDMAALHNPIGTPGVISLVEWFDAATGTIATAYILNQAPATRDYADQAGYDTLRDRFIAAVAVCMAHPPT